MYELLSRLPRGAKSAVLVGLDLCALVAAFVLCTLLAEGGVPRDAWLVLTAGALAAPALAVVARSTAVKLTGFDATALQRLALWAAGVTLVMLGASGALRGAVPAIVPVATGALLFALSIGARAGVLALLTWMNRARAGAERVAIWGAGAAGMQMAGSLQRAPDYAPVLFVDDNRALHGLLIAGLPVGGEGLLRAWARAGRIDRIIVAIPSLGREARVELLRRAARAGLPVKAMPGYADLLAADDLLGSLQPVEPGALLARSEEALSLPQIEAGHAGRSVMVTGAGGSIGSELCRQALAAGARTLVMVERSELALYEIEGELCSKAAPGRLVAVLGDVGDRAAMEALMRAHEVDVVLHAAAYKHVPLIEGNEVAGAANNVLGTQAVAEAAAAAGVRRFVLVSTDKAVRPANVMGATKRAAEMVLQDLQTRNGGTVFALVRFGNVLGSSGSVIPLFRRQIAAGGPVTLTHADVTRYFMTVSEAARLVMLAGSLAEGGEVFVLDMGAPVRIADMARRMIEMSGRTVRDEAHPHGDVAIEISGLRPGEKLYEELLIDASAMPTPHPKILRARESHPSEIEVARLVADLRAAVRERDGAAVRAALSAALRSEGPGWQGFAGEGHRRVEEA